jgi:hypothetical protein
MSEHPDLLTKEQLRKEVKYDLIMYLPWCMIGSGAIFCGLLYIMSVKPTLELVVAYVLAVFIHSWILLHFSERTSFKNIEDRVKSSNEDEFS